jgi:hypothetical protein
MSTGALRLLVAIDVGTQNMSICALRCPEHVSPCASPPLLTEAKRRLLSKELVLWEVVSLRLPKRASLPDRAAAVADFVTERDELFRQASVVVIEHQMQSVMRTVAACLFACVRLFAGPSALMISQPAAAKLRWSDLAEHGARLDTYASRKRAAVKCAYFLLDLLPQSREPSSGSPPNITKLQRILLAPGKKDDLADSLLHLCAYDCLNNPAPARGRKRTRAGAPEASEELLPLVG